MPLKTHISAFIEHLNSPTWIAHNSDNFSWSFKHSHGYDLLACICGLNKYDFQHIGFVSSSLMQNVPAYQPYTEDLNSEILEVLRIEISKKIGLNESQKNILDVFVDRVIRYGFQLKGSIIRHPDQLTAMVRELYDSEELILEHLDSVIELIDNLEYVETNKKKDLPTVLYWLLHWCYATLYKHQTPIQNQIIAENRIPAKSQALLDVYKPYFNVAQFSIQKYYHICLQAQFDQTLELDKRLNGFLGSDYYEKTHSFAVINPKKEFDSSAIFDSTGKLIPKKTTNLFYEITDTNYLDFEKANAFDQVLYYNLESNLSRTEEAIVVFLRRLFRKDEIGYDIGSGEWCVINTYTHLFSDDFYKSFSELYPDIHPSTLKYLIEPRANELFSHMYRYYIKHQNFNGYILPPINRSVEA